MCSFLVFTSKSDIPNNTPNNNKIVAKKIAIKLFIFIKYKKIDIKINIKICK